MELEVLLEPRLVDGTRALDVDPAETVVLDDLYARLSGPWSSVYDPPSPGGAAKTWPRQVGHRV
jgi:hypothetical protein